MPDLGFFHTAEACVGETIIFTDTSQLTSNLQWFIDGGLVGTTDDLNYTFDAPNTYTICMQGTHIFTQCTGCSTITIVEIPNSLDGVTVSPTIGCLPLAVTVDVGIPYDSLRINYGNGQVRYNSSTVLYDSVGDYTLMIRLFNANDCFIDTTILVQVRPAIVVKGFANPYQIGLGENTNISVVSDVPIIATTWTMPDTSTQFDIQDFNDEPTMIGVNNYHVFIEAEYGCSGEDTIQVIVLDKRNVFIPNGFTPNADGKNDQFILFSGKGVRQVKSLLIYDRWGELMFENSNFPPNDANFSWNGTFRQKAMPSGVYVYTAEFEFTDGSVIRYSGDVTLLR